MSTGNSRPSRRWLIVAVLCLAAVGLFGLFRILGPGPGRTAELADALTVDQGTSSEPTVAGAGASDGGLQPFKEALGILVNGIHLSVGGTRLNLRYVVVDAELASALTNKLYPTYLLDAKGQRLALPAQPVSSPVQDQSGQLARAGYTYSRFFPNPNHAVKPGDQVTLVIGSLRENLVVQ